jgi:hypothetical protein
MIDKSIMKILEDDLQDKNNYLAHLNELDIIYDADLINTLLSIAKLRKESFEMVMILLLERYNYLTTLSYTKQIIMEKYIGDNNTIQYYVYPSIIPNIPDGDKKSFTKAGLWFVDEKIATAYAELLKNQYNCDMKKILV